VDTSGSAKANRAPLAGRTAAKRMHAGYPIMDWFEKLTGFREAGYDETPRPA
jgi:hypothetical protein